MQLKNLVFGVHLLASLSGVALADTRCVLPVPDGGNVRPSPSNLEGVITKISGSVVSIKATKSGDATTVKLGEKLPVYTAFGGDGSISELKTGIHAWVWYVNCKPVRPGATAEAAYFQVYSFDPKDQPKQRTKGQAGSK